MIGPLSLMMERTMTAGRRDRAPKRLRLSRVERESTTPVAMPAKRGQGQRFRTQFVELADELAEFVRRSEEWRDQPATEHPHVAEPFEEADGSLGTGESDFHADSCSSPIRFIGQPKQTCLERSHSREGVQPG
jgi:hypothetical protein